jgi:hypothetical protein
VKKIHQGEFQWRAIDHGARRPAKQRRPLCSSKKKIPTATVKGVLIGDKSLEYLEGTKVISRRNMQDKKNEWDPAEAKQISSGDGTVGLLRGWKLKRIRSPHEV